MKSYVFDIDGTICTNTSGRYEAAKPIECRIKKINQLYNAGCTITLYTARGMGRHNNNQKLAIDHFYDLTKRQLDTWGVLYHNLFLGKPSGDIYIDDKGISDEQFFGN